MNVHRKVQRLQRQHRARVEPVATAWSWIAPLLLGALAAPLARPVLLWFMGGSRQAFAAGLGGLGLRLGLVLCGLGILMVHERVVRGPERAVLDPHPVAPRPLVAALGPRMLMATSGVLLGVLALLAPLALAGELRAVALTLPVIVGAWGCGVSLGFLAQLGAVWAARSPALASLLELLRGTTPPMQAALIWAPGLAIAAGGGVLVLADRGLERALLGDASGYPLLAAPLALAGLAWLPVPALAERTWYSATTLLAEIDAAWAAVENPQEERHVYLEWVLRWAPSALRPHLLRTLRAGWRARRGWITGAWGVGLLAAIAGWTDAPEAASRAMLVAAAGVALVGALGILLETADPPWLTASLGVPPAPRAIARGLATLGYLQGAILPPFLAVLFRRGVEAFALLGVLEALALAVAAAAAALGLARRRAWFAYPPLALALWVLATRSLP
ncbi:MAG: hypothetical protein ABIO70_27190 [Pseudomonadota bacterium]